MRFFTLFFFVLFFLKSPVVAQVELAAIFTNNMVLQRDTEVPIWGWGATNTTIQVTFDEKQYKATTDKDGKWMVKLPATPTGETYTITVAGNGASIELKNIVFGDVWVCSGQSNMEWTVNNAQFADSEKMNASDVLIRHFKVPHNTSYLPDEKLEGGPWELTSPETVGNFTAVGYQFAKSIRKEHDVPIGLLNTSWGGSRIEPWMSATSLGHKNDKKAAKELKNYGNKAAKKGMKMLKKQYGKLPTEDVGLVGNKAVWAATDYEDSKWATMELPNLWEDQGLKDIDGIVWFRKSLTLSAEDLKQPITLHLGKIDDSDKTYFNGKLIGQVVQQYNQLRVYQVPKDLLKVGENIITIRVEDTGGGGGIYGSTDDFYYKIGSDKISLAGAWKYKIGTAKLNIGIAANQTPIILYNKMIYPILDFPIKGVIWYQGESNANPSDAYTYRSLFATMIQDWRSRWGNNEFPFLYVQLANFMEAQSQPTESSWAMLRESQSDVLKLPNTAQAVIIDIGEADDIHPRNKHDVGYRLALGARKLAYNENQLIHSGPAYKSMQQESGKIRLSFEQVGNGLMAKGGTLHEFAIAGADKKFVWAKAKIEGNEILVWSDEVKNPVAVRYAWANNPAKANLYNKEGLPASPFRTDSW